MRTVIWAMTMVSLLLASTSAAGRAHAAIKTVGGVQETLCAAPHAAVSRGQLSTDARIVEDRLAPGFGIAHAAVATRGSRCLAVSMPRVRHAAEIIRLAGSRGVIALAFAGRSPLPANARVRLVCARAGCMHGVRSGLTQLGVRPYPTLAVILAGSALQPGSARMAFDSSGGPTVEYSLTPRGTSAWCAFTSHHVQRYVAVTVDSRVVSDPVIMSAICSPESLIVGLSSQIQARAIAAFINYGPLPLALQLR